MGKYLRSLLHVLGRHKNVLPDADCELNGNYSMVDRSHAAPNREEMMNSYLVPTTPEIIEEVAKAIARERLYKDSIRSMKKLAGVDINSLSDQERDAVDVTFERMFELVWNGTSAHDEMMRSSYRDDARVAIGVINLKLFTG